MTKGRAPWPHRPKLKLPDYLLIPEDAAALIGVSTATLGGYRHRGVGPKYSKDPWGRVRYLRADVEAWVKDEGAPRW